jgi:hypothetical protein
MTLLGPSRRELARNLKTLEVRLWRLEERVARKYPKLIVATSIRQGELAARQLGLRPVEYVIKQTAESLRGYSGEVEIYVVQPFLNWRVSFGDTLNEVRRLEAKGATVRAIWT